MQFLKIMMLAIAPAILLGQVKHDYVWIMGDNGQPSNPNDPEGHFGVNIFDFNGGEFTVTRRYQDTDFFLTNASVCDSGGDLLFYTNGCSVFRPDGELMENGAGLNPGVVYSSGNCPQNGGPIIQGALILPLPESDSLYTIFHKSLVLGSTPPFTLFDGIVYTTTVDMSGDNGLGEVVEKNHIVLSDTLYNDLQAVRHSNGVDWWVVSSSAHKNTYFTMLYTADGVAGVFEQQIGPNSDLQVNGVTSFSPDGKRFVRYDRRTQVILFDFDREGGTLSNFLHLEADTTQEGIAGAVGFSPSSRFLYVASEKEIYQYDLEAPDIQASRVLLDEYDGYKYKDIFPATFGFMQLAPDCKIYMPTRSSTPFYHVIQYPDRKGLACGFQQRGLPLIATNVGSIPNFPNYRLGTGFPVCDSTIQLVVHSVPVLPPRAEVLVYPNPASGFVILDFPRSLLSESEWVLYNGVGQRISSYKIEKGAKRAEVELQGVPPGLYFWEIRDGSKRHGSGKLVVR